MTDSLLQTVIRRLNEISLLADGFCAMSLSEEMMLIRKELRKLIRELQHELGYQPIQFED